MHALVTGGGGFLGRYIVEQLVERSDTVRVLCRGRYDSLDTLGIECVQGDIRDPKIVADACRNIDTVFHVAAVPGVWGSWSWYHGINTIGTQNVIAGCVSTGVARLIYTSSPSVVFDQRPHIGADETLPYPDRYLCHYPHSKALAEQFVLAANGQHGLSTVALRPHLIWGPRDNHLLPRLIQRAKSGRLRRVGDGTNVISMSYVENAAAAHLQAADRLTPEAAMAGQAYFINELQPVNLWQWIDELLTQAGLSPVKKSISRSAAWRIGHCLELAWQVLRLTGEPPMTRFVAAQLADSHSYSVAKAQRDFDYQPVIDSNEAIRRTASRLRCLGQ